MEYLSGKGSYSSREQFPLPQVILLDLKMPRVNGFEFLEWLRNDSPGDLHLLPVVVLSNSDEPGDVNRAYDLGANSYVMKAANMKQFQEGISTLNGYWSWV